MVSDRVHVIDNEWVSRAMLIGLIEQALEQKLEVFKLRVMEDIADLVMAKLRDDPPSR